MKGKGLVVTLDWNEVRQAAMVGVERQLDAMRRGLSDKHGFDGSGWDIHVEGAAGEMAFAKAASRYWGGDVGTFKQADLMGNVQVRTRSSLTYDLIVRPGDDAADLFVLVVGKAPRFVVQGWLPGVLAKQPQFSKAYGGRPSAYFVPVANLLPFPIKPVGPPMDLEELAA